jgi:hypothetical protein
MESGSREFISKVLESLTADRYKRVSVETGPDDSVYGRRNGADDGVIDALLDEPFYDIKQ